MPSVGIYSYVINYLCHFEYVIEHNVSEPGSHQWLLLLLFDKMDDVPPPATDGNQEGEQSAETLKENIRLIEVCSVLAVYYASPVHREIVPIAKGEVHLSQKDYLVNLDIDSTMTPLKSY